MSFKTTTELLFNKHVEQSGLKDEYDYIEYGMDFVRFKKEGGNVFEIRVREIRPRVKTVKQKIKEL